ncbi:hypothetical protein [Paenibacillus aestuarii]|uniref:Carboxypeptidase regulatory-like domain-containing protein n=1 Tax=Paenibacillus aestuarii TaxID=516965 RepID=A0ABW0K932_9BACL|nr:hypothetical protein [Paenibacillus aestuarii]
MDNIRVSHFKTRVSLVVGVIDPMTAGAPLGNSTTVHLEGARSKAIRKANGSYIFNDLVPGEYHLFVRNENYFDEQRHITVGTGNMMVFIQLNPLPSYPFSPGAGLIRLMLRDEAGAPCQEAKLAAVITNEACTRARVMMEQADKGTDEVLLGSFTGIVTVGDSYLLRGRGAKAADERIRIAEVQEYQKRFRLEQRLAKSFARGSLLLPVQESRVTERGEAALAFRGARVPAFQVDLTITYGQGLRHEMKGIAVTEGTVTNLGVIRLA